MKLSKGANATRKACGLLGILQGLAWSLLALTSIILYNEQDRIIEPKSYMDLVGYDIYNFFFVRKRYWSAYEGQLFTPSVFTGFAWIHLIFNLGWLVSSIVLIYKKGEFLDKAMKNWSQLVAIISVWDLTTVIMLGVDYDRCVSSFSGIEYNVPLAIERERMCTNAVLPILVVAGKGFVLMVLNMVMAKVLNVIRKRCLREEYQAEAPPAYHRQAPPPYSPPSCSTV